MEEIHYNSIFVLMQIICITDKPKTVFRVGKIQNLNYGKYQTGTAPGKTTTETAAETQSPIPKYKSW